MSKVDVNQASTRSASSSREKAGEKDESIGSPKLYIDDQVVAEDPRKTQPAKLTLSGDGLCVGFDNRDAVSQEYTSPRRFKGGATFGVAVTTEKAQDTDLQ